MYFPDFWQISTSLTCESYYTNFCLAPYVAFFFICQAYVTLSEMLAMRGRILPDKPGYSLYFGMLNQIPNNPLPNQIAFINIRAWYMDIPFRRNTVKTLQKLQKKLLTQRSGMSQTINQPFTQVMAKYHFPSNQSSTQLQILKVSNQSSERMFQHQLCALWVMGWKVKMYLTSWDWLACLGICTVYVVLSAKVSFVPRGKLEKLLLRQRLMLISYQHSKPFASLALMESQLRDQPSSPCQSFKLRVMCADLQPQNYA